MFEGLMGAAKALAIVVQALLLFNLAYLLFVTSGALLARRFPRRPSRFHDPRPQRMAILIPAHDEEKVIGPLLMSLEAQHYPATFATCFVVADNCQDATADAARAHGVEVFERQAPGPSSKGQALLWLWRQIAERHHRFDAVVLLDADNLADPGFLAALDAQLGRGAPVVQGIRRSKNPDLTPASALDSLAEALNHQVAAAGRHFWGLSGLLSGSGVAFRRDVFHRLVARTSTHVEDCEWQLQLMREGTEIRWAPDAVVYDEKISDFDAMAHQRTRWLQGKFGLIASQFLPLVWGALRRHGRSLDGLCYVLAILPRSVLLIGLIGAGLMSALWPAGFLPWPVWGIAILGFASYIGAGLFLERANGRMITSLLYAPIFIRYLLTASLRALGRRKVAWVPTRHDVVTSIRDLEGKGRSAP
jgi:cellulose synthase/poly-beta-1,6-N-acetylglucosamine synthase-like glycosyltransferase